MKLGKCTDPNGKGKLLDRYFLVNMKMVRKEKVSQEEDRISEEFLLHCIQCTFCTLSLAQKHLNMIRAERKLLDTSTNTGQGN